ncbi:hypothetical protein [Micromonospora avicenniae]|uniref:hypothetical protein n=1 Tax=Micromonospora avicenniae TaxID=1198245 RepID=UPI0033303920
MTEAVILPPLPRRQPVRGLLPTMRAEEGEGLRPATRQVERRALGVVEAKRLLDVLEDIAWKPCSSAL